MTRTRRRPSGESISISRFSTGTVYEADGPPFFLSKGPLFASSSVEAVSQGVSNGSLKSFRQTLDQGPRIFWAPAFTGVTTLGKAVKSHRRLPTHGTSGSCNQQPHNTQGGRNETRAIGFSQGENQACRPCPLETVLREQPTGSLQHLRAILRHEVRGPSLMEALLDQ